MNMEYNQSELMVSEEDTQSGKYLLFMLEDECYGLEIRYVVEIIGIQKVSRLPESPDYVKGIINLRGTIIPVIDMRLRLKKKEAEYNDRTCIVVVYVMDTKIGLIVDCVNEVACITGEAVVPAPDYRASYQNKYIKGIGNSDEGIRLLLDCQKIFREDEIEAFSNISEQ